MTNTKELSWEAVDLTRPPFERWGVGEARDEFRRCPFVAELSLRVVNLHVKESGGENEGGKTS